jgi:hypothetical protein
MTVVARDRLTWDGRATNLQNDVVAATRRDRTRAWNEALRQLGQAIVNDQFPEDLYRALGATPPSVSPGERGEEELNTPLAMDQDSFRDLLAFSISSVIGSNRPLLGQILKEHVSDDARARLANKVLEHLEFSGFTIDESAQVMRRLPRGRGW